MNVFHYKDYRTYLKEWYQEAKKQHPAFSFRSFSKKAGFESSNFLMLVMNGQRNLTPDSLAKCIKGLGLNKQEQDFFENLVLFNQGKDLAEKDLYYKRLIKSKKFQQLKPIEKKQYEYYSDWYHPVVRELIAAKEFDGTPEWLADNIFPRISVAQAAKSLKLLEDLELIKKVGPNQWKQSDTILSTGPTLSSIVVHNYHKNLLDLTKTLMDHLPVERRDVSTMTLGVGKDRLGDIIKKVREFRQEILKMVSTETHPEEVVQLNIQLFPMTQKRVKMGGKETL
ncbi:MAG: TIGR02147 family protein [bacterium]|nr:TIGR02147 family protein [bacterium]